ncbi:MAG: MFS transporter [Alphaproteobacteria bacterium]|nr:MFS transporter [Alphaproteobacteria bacterium]
MTATDATTKAARPGVGALFADPLFVRIWLVGLCGGIARWLEMLVVGIFAYDATGSPFLVALLVMLRMAPLSLFGSLVGTAADRMSPRLLLIVALAGAGLISGSVCGLFLFGWPSYWVVAVASVAAGFVWTCDMPLRRRILGDIAGHARIGPAMGIDSATNNATRMVGPFIGGVLYEWLGTDGAFALTTCLYVVCVAMVILIPARVSEIGEVRAPSRLVADLREGFAYAARNPDVLRILVVTVVFNVWGFPFVSMVPVLGRDVLMLDAHEIGLLAALEAGGAFVGTLLIATRLQHWNFRGLYYFGTMMYLCFIFLTGWMTATVPMAVVLFGVGIGMAGFSAMQSTLIYGVAPPQLRGRLFGLVTLCIGSGVVGAANIGLMAEWFGAATAVRIIAVEGLVALALLGVGWRELRRGR